MKEKTKTKKERGPMLILIGESASGKSTVQRVLAERGIRKVVTYTTRPMRPGEMDGIDYHFVTDERFLEMVEAGEFAEYAEYRGWRYGTALADCGYRNTSAALTPAGLRALKRAGVPNSSVYLKVDRLSRLIKCLQRDGEKKIEESYRRNLSDVGQFDAVEYETDHVVRNDRYEKSEIIVANEIRSLYEADLANSTRRSEA